MARVPIANWVLIGLTIVCSVKILVDLRTVAQHRPQPRLIDQDLLNENQVTVDDEIAYPLALWRGRDFRLWQLLTNVFVHADVLHLVGNMYFLFVFGNAINAKLGHALFVCLYFLFGVIANLGWLSLGNGDCVVGASGAIAGITGMLLVYYPRNDVALLRWGWLEWRYMPEAIAAGWVILFYMVCDLWGMIADDNGVAYVSHVVGALCGIGIAIALLRWKWVETPYGEENLLQVFGWERASGRKARKRKNRLAQKPEISRFGPEQRHLPPDAGDVRGWG
jgi:membrane associated rhomboid family serine protease